MNTLPKHKYLLTYRYAEMIHDLTVEFCQIFIIGDLGHRGTLPVRRTIDQMVQAARSGKQNIVEAVGQSRTSKKGEIKLLGVAAASLEELITDFEDFLRQRELVIYSKTDPRVLEFKKTAFRVSHLSNLGILGDLKEKPRLPNKPEEAANFLLTFCHLATYLLSRQISKAEEQFLQGGGYTENLFRKRLDARNKSSK